MNDWPELKNKDIDPSKEKRAAEIERERNFTDPRTFNTNPSISFRHEVKQ